MDHRGDALTQQKRKAALGSLRQRYGQRLTTPEESSLPEESSFSLLLADKQAIAAQQAEPTNTTASQPRLTALKTKLTEPGRSKNQEYGQAQGIIPANFIEDIKQWAGSAEIDLSGVEDEQLEKRYAELQYYSKWLITIYKEIQKEIFLLKKQLQDNDSNSSS